MKMKRTENNVKEFCNHKKNLILTIKEDAIKSKMECEVCGTKFCLTNNFLCDPDMLDNMDTLYDDEDMLIFDTLNSMLIYNTSNLEAVEIIVKHMLNRDGYTKYDIKLIKELFDCIYKLYLNTISFNALDEVYSNTEIDKSLSVTIEECTEGLSKLHDNIHSDNKNNLDESINNYRKALQISP